MESLLKPNIKFLCFLAGLTALAFGLALSGWWQILVPKPLPGHNIDLSHLGDVVYRALKSVSMGEVYDQVDEEFKANRCLEAARFIGFFVESSAILLLVMSLFHQNWIRFNARLHSHHIIVLGQSAFADKLCETRAGKVIHLRSLDDDVHADGHFIRLPFAGFNVDNLTAAGAARAAQIVIAPEDDSFAIDLALSTRNAFDKVSIDVRLHDFWLTRRFPLIPGAERLRAFCDAEMAAHEIVLRFPPYLLAHDYGHARSHALLIGDHDQLEALMAEILLTGSTLRLGKPAFSFICAEPMAFAARLKKHYPELDLAADLAFYQADQLTHTQAFETGMAKIAELGPITCVYSALKAGADAMTVALTIVEQAHHDIAFVAPVFVLMNSVHGLHRPAPGSHLEPCTLVSFGTLEDIARASGLMSKESELAEQAYHSVYLETAPKGGDAARPWPELKEEYRSSNRRAAAHIYAKLFEAGFDVGGWMASQTTLPDLPVLAEGEPLWRDEDERMRLAKLEHDRWIVDRRLNGWSYNPVRDNRRKWHPQIKPFEELTLEVQSYDYQFVDLLGKLLQHSPDGMRRP